MKKYVIGNGNTCITSGIFKEIEIPFIAISNIEEGKSVGDDLLNTQIEEANRTVILIKNLEGLAVLEKALKLVKAKLKEQNVRATKNTKK